MTDNTIEPLEGEAVIPGVTAKKPARANTRQLFAIGALLLSVIAVLVFTLVRHFTRSAAETAEKTPAPEVASGRVGKLAMPPQPMPAAAGTAPGAAPRGASESGGTRVGEIDPDVAPIPLRGAAGGAGGAGSSHGPKVVNPDDAPIFPSGATPDLHAQDKAGAAPAASSKQLDSYQAQVAPLIQQLQRMTAGGGGAGRPPLGASAAGAEPAANGSPAAAAPPLFGTMERSATPTVQARLLADRSLTIPKGTLFTCSLKTRVVTATNGLVGCQVTRNVFSDDGRVLLIERGSHLDGEYRIVQVRPGVTRIPVLWTRVRTQTASIDLDSPATGQLGESGLGGYVDNRWGERLGASLLLSLIDDAVKFGLASQGGNSSGGNNAFVLPNTTAQGSKLAERVLEATINIPPLLYQNQGGVVGVYVARDIDFSSVYELKPQ
jgi:type IV secretion system protein VirB10